MENLFFLLKKEFILLYTTEDFLNKFHNRIIQSITDNSYTIIDNKIILYPCDVNHSKNLTIPNLPKLGKLDLDKIIYSAAASLLPILTLTLCTLCLEERTEGGKAQSAGWVAPPLPQGREAGRAAASATLKRGGGEGGSAPARLKDIFR